MVALDSFNGTIKNSYAAHTGRLTMLPKLALSLILVQTFLRPAVAQTSTASAAAAPAPSASQESWEYVAKRVEAGAAAAYPTPSAGAVSVAEDHRYAATAARTGAL